MNIDFKQALHMWQPEKWKSPFIEKVVLGANSLLNAFDSKLATTTAVEPTITTSTTTSTTSTTTSTASTTAPLIEKADTIVLEEDKEDKEDEKTRR